MKLIIVQGPTSTGKSTLARKLAKDLGIAAFCKDDYKEREFDKLKKTPNLRMWFKIENDSWQAMCKMIESAIQKDEPLIIEGNLLRSHRRKIKELLQPNTIVAEIYCYANGRTMLKRYISRSRQIERHKDHRDRLFYPSVAIEAAAAGLGLHFYRPLRLSPNVLRVDTTDFATVDYAAIRRFIINAN